MTRRNVAELANPKAQQVVVNRDKLEEEIAPHAKDVDIALAAFGVAQKQLLCVTKTFVIRSRPCSRGLCFDPPAR